MLTARQAAALTVGNTGTLGTTDYVFNRTLINLSDPASGTGTITSVTLNAAFSGNLYVMTGSVSGSNFTIRAIGSIQAVVGGANTFAVSLVVVVGDYIGLYVPGSGAWLRYGSVAGKNLGYNTSQPTSLPTPGGVLAFSTDGGLQLSLGGTG